MVAPACAVSEETPVAKAIEALLEHRVSALPVVKDGKLVGILSYVDLLRAFGKKLA